MLRTNERCHFFLIRRADDPSSVETRILRVQVQTFDVDGAVLRGLHGSHSETALAKQLNHEHLRGIFSEAHSNVRDFGVR